MPEVSGKYLYYKNRPLVREKDTICYGDKAEKCLLLLEIISYKEEHGTQVPGNVLIQVIDSHNPGKIVRQGQKIGLHDAFSMGLIWLERAVSE